MTVIDPRARNTDPETSHAAAEAAKATAGECRVNVLTILLANPAGLTHEELIAEYRTRGYGHHSESGIRTRCRELVAQGRVERTDQRRKTATGKSSIVWRAKGAGPAPARPVVEVPERRHLELYPTDIGEGVDVSWSFSGARAGQRIGYVFPWPGRGARFAYRTTRGQQGVATSFEGALRKLVGTVYGQAVQW